MNATDNRETNDPSLVTEDLNAPNAEAIKVKGGYTKIVLQDCLVSSWQTSA